MTSSNLLWSGFVLLTLLVTLAHGWLGSEPCKRKPNKHDNNPCSDRLDFLQSSLLTFTTIASVGPVSPQTVLAADGDDPFAALDSFAASIGSTPPSSLNPPSSNESSASNDSGKGASQPTVSSDMSEALKDIRKQKRIDPRTHG